LENKLGVQAPVGFSDPLGSIKDGDVTKFERRPQVELKHSRVARLAARGYITPEYLRFSSPLSTSLNLKFASMPSGLAALSKMPAADGFQWSSSAAPWSAATPSMMLAGARAIARTLASWASRARRAFRTARPARAV